MDKSIYFKLQTYPKNTCSEGNLPHERKIQRKYNKISRTYPNRYASFM